MCATCGCRRPRDPHKDARNITVTQLYNAALAAGVPVDVMLQNATQALTEDIPVRAFMTELAKPRIVCDIDGTLAERDLPTLVAINSKFNTEYRYSDITETAGDWIEDKKQRKWFKKHRHDPIFIVDLPPYEDAMWALWSLRSAGYFVIIASDREKELFNISKQWLAEMGIQYDDIHIGDGEKLKLASTASTANPMVFFDDNPERAADLPRPGVTLFLLDRPWNQKVGDTPGVIRVKTWPEILAHLPAQAQLAPINIAGKNGHVQKSEDQPRDEHGKFESTGGKPETHGTEAHFHGDATHQHGGATEHGLPVVGHTHAGGKVPASTEKPAGKPAGGKLPAPKVGDHVRVRQWSDGKWRIQHRDANQKVVDKTFATRAEAIQHAHQQGWTARTGNMVIKPGMAIPPDPMPKPGTGVQPTSPGHVAPAGPSLGAGHVPSGNYQLGSSKSLGDWEHAYANGFISGPEYAAGVTNLYAQTGMSLNDARIAGASYAQAMGHPEATVQSFATTMGKNPFSGMPAGDQPGSAAFPGKLPGAPPPLSAAEKPQTPDPMSAAVLQQGKQEPGKVFSGLPLAAPTDPLKPAPVQYTPTQAAIKYQTQLQFAVQSGAGDRVRSAGMAQITKMDSAGRAAITNYSGSWYGSINASLRSGVMTANEKAQVAAMDKALGQTKVPENVIVGRTVSSSVIGQIQQAQVGGVFKDAGYTSTSLYTSGDHSGGKALTIEIPKGSPGVYIEGISLHPSEQEFLLPRESEFEVTKITSAGASLRYIGSTKSENQPDLANALSEVKVPISGPANNPAFNNPAVRDIQSVIGSASKVDGPHGSQPGDWYKLKDGSQVYAKPMSMDRAQNEVATNIAYRVLGGATPGKDVPATYIAQDKATGQAYVISHKIEGLTLRSGSEWQSGDGGKAATDAQRLWAVDVLLSNRDAVGLQHDNLAVHPSGGVTRIDQGAGMRFRAQGSEKPDWKPGGAWSEPWTMRGGTVAGNAQAKNVFGRMTNQQASDALGRLRASNNAETLRTLRQLWHDQGMSKLIIDANTAVIVDRLNRIPQIQSQLLLDPNAKAAA